MAKETRSHSIIIRVTEAEKRAIEEGAAKAGMTTSSYLRHSAIRQKRGRRLQGASQ